MVTTKSPALTLKIVGLAASVSLVSLVVAPKANAVTLFTSSDSFTNQLTELDGTQALTVSKYTPQAGNTVTKVIVKLAASLTSSGTIKNTASQAQTFTIATRVGQYDFSPSAGDPSVLSTLSPFADNALIGKTKYTNLDPNISANFGSFTTNASTSVTFTGADIAQFLGSGTFSFNPFTTVDTVITGGGGNVSTDIKTFADATLQVQYIDEHTATAVPEPTTMGLLAAVGGLFAMKKRFGFQKSKVQEF